MSYARARMAGSLASDLSAIGRLVAGQREQTEEKRLRDEERLRARQMEDTRLLQFAAERGGGLGPAPTAVKTPMPPPRGDILGLGSRPQIDVGDPGLTKTPPPRPSRYVETPGQRAYYVPQDVQDREEAKATNIAGAAERDRTLGLLGDLPHVPDASARAMAGGVPAGVAMPPRPTRAPTAPRPTINQAIDIVRRRYEVVDTSSGKPIISGYSKSDEEMYAEAQELAAGQPMRPMPPKPLGTAPPLEVPPPRQAPVATPSPMSGTPSMPTTGQPGVVARLGRFISGDTAPAPSPSVASPSSAPPVPMPVTAPSAAPTAMPPRPLAGARTGASGLTTPAADFGAAQRRARELQAAGKTPEEIIATMAREGFRVQR